MPPKKQEEVDISSLPPWVILTVAIRFDCSKNRADKIREFLRTSKSFQKNISRDDIIAAAKERGLYIDISQQQEKKKDSKPLADVQTELNPALLAKTLNLMVADLNLQGRKLKKDMIDGKNNVVQIDPKAKVDPKAGAKADPKKAGAKAVVEAVVVVDAVVVEKEKEYLKNFDQLYLLFDYPEGSDDILEVFAAQMPINIVLVVKERITNWGGVDMGLLEQPGDFEGDLRERMDEFIDEGEDAQQKVRNLPKPKRGMSPNSREFCMKERGVLGEILKTRSQSDRTDILRNVVMKELVVELDLDIEDETLKAYCETVVEELCAMSLDSQQFTEWIQTKKTLPLMTKPPILDAFDQEIQMIKEQAMKAEEERNHQENLLLQQQQEQGKGKGGKKETKKTDEELLREKQMADERRLMEEARQLKLDQAFEQQTKLKAKMHMQYYKKQLSQLDEQRISGGVLLEVMLDQIDADKQQLTTGKQTTCIEDDLDSQRVIAILNSLESLISTSVNQSTHAVQPNSKKESEYKWVIDEHDEIEIKAFGAILANQQKISDREFSCLKNLSIPGIDRFMMPEVSEKSELLRKAEKSKLYPFISVEVHEFERRCQLIRFEELMKETESEQEWNFGDRIYLERHNKNTLTQVLTKLMLYDPHVLGKYNERDDSFQLVLYHKNPPGRMLRRKWSAEWRVLPNLESWLNFFKNNEMNIRNETFYDIDYQSIGNFHERSKVLYPTDNSLILATKYQVGSQTHIRYRVVKEGVVFQIQRQSDGSNLLNALFNDSMRLTVQQHDELASFNLTLPYGLIVRFMPNGDVHQSYPQHNTKARDSSGMLHLYDNAEINSDQEVRRVITGKGSVIKYMKDGSVLVLYANGNTQLQLRNGTWITTNNRGLRRAKRIKDGVQWALDPVPCAHKNDPETNSNVYIRDDQTMVIKYKDGSQYTQHRDGTKMLIGPSGDSVVVEHEQFCSVKVSVDRVKQRTGTVIGMGSAYANVGFDNLFERSNDGRVVETFLGEKARVVTYREKQELPNLNEYKTNTINLIYLSDGAVCKIVDDGEVAIITAQERMRLNQKGEQRKDELDIDYWLQLFSVAEERKSGVFTIQLNEGKIWTRDDESNYFSISADGDVDAQVSVSLNMEQGQEQQNNNDKEQQSNYDRPSTPEIPEGDYIDEENKFLPPPTQWIPPRLFVISNDNTGTEFLGEQQLNYYLRRKAINPLCNIVTEQGVSGILNCTSLTFITQIVDHGVVKAKLIKVKIPQTLDIIPKTFKRNPVPAQRIYTLRNLLRFEPFDKEAKDSHQKDLERFEIWRRDMQKSQSEFGVIQKPDEERDAEFNIQLRIIESRKTDYSNESYDQQKQRILDKRDQFNDVLLAYELEQNNIPPPKKVKNFERGETIQSAMLNLHKKSQVSSKVKQILQKQEDQPHINGFVQHYFLTIEGMNADKTFPINVFDVKERHSRKIMNEQEYTVYANSQSNKTYKNNEEQEIVDSQQDPLMVLEAPKFQTKSILKPIILRQSVFTQAEVKEEIQEQKIINDAIDYRMKKNQKVNVYGQERQDTQKKLVPCLLKTNPRSELNQKYILTDSLTDNRMKISSMATRVYQQAPSINDIRNEGYHQTLNKTLDKKNNFEELSDKRNLMINAELNDRLQRDLSVIPIAARFSSLKQGGLYQIKISVKNEDILAQRINLKQPQSRFAKVFMKQMGPVSLGIVREVWVQLDAQWETLGQFQDEFKIVSKHQVYSIPISAHIYEQQAYDSLNQECRKQNHRNIQKTYVHELRFEQTGQSQQELVDSQNSEILPKINYDKNYKVFNKIDPFKGQNQANEVILDEDDD